MKKKYAQKAGGTGRKANSRFKKPAIETPMELVITPKTIYTMKEIVAMCLAKRKSA